EIDDHSDRINPSALASSEGGIVKPSALAVFRLITNSILVGCRAFLLHQPKRLKHAQGLSAGISIEIGRQRRDQRDHGGCDPAPRLDLSKRRVFRAGRHAAASTGTCT